MPYEGKWQDMPADTFELADRIMEGFNAGLKEGRQQGAAEITDRVDDFVKTKYFSAKVERGSEYGEAILELARELVHGLRHGDLGKVDDFKKRGN